MAPAAVRWPAAACRLSDARLREVCPTLRSRDLLRWLVAHDLSDERGRHRKGRLWWSVEHMAEKARLSVATVARALADLRAAGLIERHQRGRGRVAVTVICWGVLCPGVQPSPITSRCQGRQALSLVRGPLNRAPRGVEERQAPSPLRGLEPPPEARAGLRPPPELRDPAARAAWIAEAHRVWEAQQMAAG